MARSRPPGPPPSNINSELSGRSRIIVSALAGILLGAAFTSPGLPPLAWVSVAPLIAMAVGARPGIAFACGFVNAIAFVLTCLFWIATVLKVHGGVSEAGGVGVLLLIAAAWGCVTGSFAWCIRRISRASITRACLAVPFLWVSFEFVRDHLPEISFPWNLLGYPAAGSLALMQMTTVTGIFGLSFVVAGFNALCAWTILAKKEFTARTRFGALGASTIVLLAIVVACPQLVPSAPARHSARGVQLNLPELDDYPVDWFQANASQLEEFDRLSLAPAKPGSDLLIWPEAPAPFSMQDPRFARLASSLAVRSGHAFLAGVIEWKRVDASASQLSPFNSAVLLDGQGQRVFSYDKIHLVPFGEYEPFPLIHRVVRSVSSEVGGFRPGLSYSVGQLPGGYRFGVFICYESIFPGEVRRFVAGGADLLINISNDGWFGRSAAPEQHLRMARVRAVENRRWLVRVTNNGFTVSVDPYGRIVASLPADVRNAADLPYDFRTDTTLYTRFGDWFAWLCVAASVAFFALAFARRG
jgi:apolipoprotein N-acyltransferase